MESAATKKLDPKGLVLWILSLLLCAAGSLGASFGFLVFLSLGHISSETMMDVLLMSLYFPGAAILFFGGLTIRAFNLKRMPAPIRYLFYVFEGLYLPVGMNMALTALGLSQFWVGVRPVIVTIGIVASFAALAWLLVMDFKSLSERRIKGKEVFSLALLIIGFSSLFAVIHFNQIVELSSSIICFCALIASVILEGKRVSKTYSQSRWIAVMLFFFWQVFLFYHFMTTLIYTPTQIAWEWALPFAIWVIYALFSFIKERVYSSKQRTDAFYD